MSLALWANVNNAFMVACVWLIPLRWVDDYFGWRRPSWVKILTTLVRWPWLISIIAYPVLEALLDKANIATGLITCLYLWNWYTSFKNKDDDDWKRKKKQLAAKVTEVAGRLVVVPTAAHA